jgi:GR25 family glycosyltransferase involved in LPS biosynthesis
MRIAILVTAFNRPKELRLCLEALKNVENQIIVSIDGPRNNRDRDLIEECKAVIEESLPDNGILWFANENRGCYRSISEAITRTLVDYEAVIVIEDDIVVANDFVPFTALALTEFSSNKSIGSICAMNLVPNQNLEHPKSVARLSIYADSWGWATWRDRWEDFVHVESPIDIEKSIKTLPMSMVSWGAWKKILKSVYRNEIDSWAYRWMWTNWKKDRLHLVFNISLVSNIGFGVNSTHTKKKLPNMVYSANSKSLELTFKQVPRYDKSADKWMERNVFKTDLVSRLVFLRQRIFSKLKRHQ